MQKNKALKIEQVAINELVPYIRNTRSHSPQQVQQIAASIREFGFTNPILIKSDKTIIAGHGRLEAAHLLNLEKVPCIILDYLTDAQAKALSIADNKLPLNAAWNSELLQLEIEELSSEGFTVEMLGFTESEFAVVQIKAMVEAGDDVPEKANDDNKTTDNVLTMSFPVSIEQEVVIRKAIGISKAKGVTSTGEALEVICRNWLEELGNEAE